MRRYTERYVYDAVGNFLQLQSTRPTNGSWTRAYAYDEPSLLEPARRSNRLEQHDRRRRTAPSPTPTTRTAT